MFNSWTHFLALLLASSPCLASSKPIDITPNPAKPKRSSPLRREVLGAKGKLRVLELEESTNPLVVPRLKFKWIPMEDLLNPPSEFTPDGFFLRAVFSSEGPQVPNESPQANEAPK